MSLTAVRRRHGLFKAVLFAACRAIQRFILFDVTYVVRLDAENIDLPASDSKVECRFLSAEEVQSFAADPTNDIGPELADRLSLGCDYCFAGLLDGRLAGYCWLALHSIEAKHNRATESLNSGVAFSYPKEYAFRYKGFVHPDFRGRRIYQQIGLKASLALQERGVRYVISTGEVVNYAASISNTRCGFETLGFVVLAGIGGRVISRLPNLSRHGILMGRHANVFDRDAFPSPCNATAPSDLIATTASCT